MTEAQRHIILKVLSGTNTDEEQRKLSAWMEESAVHKKEFEDYERVWQMSGREPAALDFQSEAEWRRLQNSLDETGNKHATPIHLAGFSWMKVAASLALVVAAGMALYLTVLHRQTSVVESGDRQTHIVMPDGSAIWLNRNSRITYEADFGEDSRMVHLTGEAFFEVAKDASKPFVVNTSDLEVKVLGTSFNVRAPNAASRSEVLVVTGVVSVAANAGPGHPPLKLTPGEKATLDKARDRLTRTTPGEMNSLAWKTKKLSFKKSSLQDVVATLEDYFGIRITVKNADLLRCRFTSSFYDPTLEEVIEALGISLNLNILEQDNIYVVDGEGC